MPQALRPEPEGRLRPVLTGRALVLGALVILLVVVLASPVKRYLGSRNDVGQAAAQLRSDEQQLHALSRQKALWSDPGYVQAQARKRLQFAMPGDTVYVVVGNRQRSTIQRTRGSAHSTVLAAPAWNQRLWASIRAAGG